MIKAVCFDLDDTLCNYEKSSRISRRKMFNYAVSKCNGVAWSQLQRAYNECLSAMMKEQGGEAVFIRKSGWEVRRELIDRTLRACGINDPPLVKELVELYSEQRRRTLKLFPDALQVLSSLHDRYPLGLITNGPSDIQREEISHLKIQEYFDHITVSGEVGYAKPDPRIFQLAVAKFHLFPPEVLYVGNSQETDVAGAHGAGLKVAWLNRKDETLRSGIPKPHHEIKSLLKRLDLL